MLTGFGRARRLTERAAQTLPEPCDVLELDVNEPSDLAALATELEHRWGGIDGALHAVAYAPADALGGGFLQTPGGERRGGVPHLGVLAQGARRGAAPALRRGGRRARRARLRRPRRLAGLRLDGGLARPRSSRSPATWRATSVRSGVRVNLVSAGPLETLAAGGIPGFEALADGWVRQAPLGWDAARRRRRSPTPSASCCPTGARAITGEILHVDGGYHAMGAPS